MKPPWETRAEALKRFDERIVEAKAAVVEAERVRDAVSDLITARPDLDVTSDAFASEIGLIVIYKDPAERAEKRAAHAAEDGS